MKMCIAHEMCNLLKQVALWQVNVDEETSKSIGNFWGKKHNCFLLFEDSYVNKHIETLPVQTTKELSSNEYHLIGVFVLLPLTPWQQSIRGSCDIRIAGHCGGRQQGTLFPVALLRQIPWSHWWFCTALSFRAMLTASLASTAFKP